MTPSGGVTGPARRPVAMLTHSYYEEDPRVRREAEALVAAGRPVDVYGLRRPGDDAEAVDRRRAPPRASTCSATRAPGWRRTCASTWRSSPGPAGPSRAPTGRRHYALVQVHTMPDFLVFAGLPLRTRRACRSSSTSTRRCRTSSAIRFPRAASPLARRALGVQERLSIRAASHVIIVNEALRDRLVGLGVRPDKVTVVPNSPSLARFDPAAVRGPPVHGGRGPAPRLRRCPDPDLRARRGRRRGGPAGRAAARAGRPVRRLRPRRQRAGAARARPRQPASTNAVTFRGRIPFEAVPAALAAADIGLAPTRLDAYTRFSLSTKIFEYGAMRRAVVATRLPLVERTFGEGTVLTYEPGDAGRPGPGDPGPRGRSGRSGGAGGPDRGADRGSSPGSARWGATSPSSRRWHRTGYPHPRMTHPASMTAPAAEREDA